MLAGLPEFGRQLGHRHVRCGPFSLDRGELRLEQVQAIAEGIGAATLPFPALFSTVCPCLCRISASYGGVSASRSRVGPRIRRATVGFGRVDAIFGLFGLPFGQLCPQISLFYADISCGQ